MTYALLFTASDKAKPPALVYVIACSLALDVWHGVGEHNGSIDLYGSSYCGTIRRSPSRNTKSSSPPGVTERFFQVDTYWVLVWNIELLEFRILGTFG